MKELIAGKNESGQRLDKLLFKYLPDAGKGFVYKMIRKKNITLNDSRCEGNETVNEGDSIKLWMSDETIAKFSRSESDSAETVSLHKSTYKLYPLYEDDDIIVFNKPAGLLSQKSKPDDISVNDILIKYLIDSGQLSAEQLKTFRPSICNRLDRNTSGIVICGKSLKGLQDMAFVLKDRSLHKDYIAVVEGELRTAGSLKGYITKDRLRNIVTDDENGEYIETEYRPLSTDGNRSFLMVRLITGKTHQIRFHLASCGHPIVGDRKYGSGKGASRQLLHAFRITFKDGQCITADLPEDMKWEHGNPGAFEDLPLKI